MEKTLVWMTHSFRLDSRLTSRLSGPCTFVYYSPYYFSQGREYTLLHNCSKSNLEAFYESLYTFNKQLNSKRNKIYIFKKENVIEHINFLIDKYDFTSLVIDQSLFAMWKNVDLTQIKIPVTIIDSDLIDDQCLKMTAKSRWMTHVKNLDSVKLHGWNDDIYRFSIDEPVESYPDFKKNNLIDASVVLCRSFEIRKDYKNSRDKHNGQTRLSTAFQNGVLDPHNVFYQMAKEFKNEGADFTINDGAHAAMLRQFAFREMTIIRTRNAGLTMEDSPSRWASKFLTEKSLDNLMARVNHESDLTFRRIKHATTGDKLVDKILSESYKTGVMPNRARMFFAGWLFYNAPSGIIALNWLILTFDLLLLDGQCPTNYIQCVSSMNLQYGKVMLLNRDNVEALLSYPN